MDPKPGNRGHLKILDDLAEARLPFTRNDYPSHVATVPLFIIDDLGMRKLPHKAAEDLLESVMRRYERASTLLGSNRPVEDWGKLLGDTAAVIADARPAPPPRARPHLWTAELVHPASTVTGPPS
jgi:hypothetical protein